MKLLYAVVMIAALGLLTGCQMLGPNNAQTNASLEAYKAFIAQQRSYESVTLIGTADRPAKLEAMEIHIASALPELKALPSDDSKSRLFDTIRAIAGYATAGYLGSQLIGNGNSYFMGAGGGAEAAAPVVAP
jgi:hypothetical protein